MTRPKPKVLSEKYRPSPHQATSGPLANPDERGPFLETVNVDVLAYQSVHFARLGGGGDGVETVSAVSIGTWQRENMSLSVGPSRLVSPGTAHKGSYFRILTALGQSRRLDPGDLLEWVTADPNPNKTVTRCIRCAPFMRRSIE
ncbi:hypothetical protein FALBO_16754 [Fusarium albosuccineum]|uniref:Uncharacterized protein n=1 Tax=Fusarium albosuccineum TaxID=1237068 RepID=A0A8H4P5C1_9HYPO|nr:hypothetical protein FALBO_16754 [Fusarium albosuccineum]